MNTLKLIFSLFFLILIIATIAAQETKNDLSKIIQEENFDCTSPCPVLATRTYVLSPGPRTRTTIAVGEHVEIKIKKNKNNKCGTPVFTLVEDESEGILEELTPDTYVFIAGINEGITKIKVTFDASNCDTQCGSPSGSPIELEIIFNVLRPTGLTFVNTAYSLNEVSCSSLIHAPNRPSTGFIAKVYMLPDNVNFYNILTREQYAEPELIGDYPIAILAAGVPIPGHAQNLFWGNTINVFPGKGTESDRIDKIWFAGPCSVPPTSDGSITYNIPWDFKLLSNETILREELSGNFAKITEF